MTPNAFAYVALFSWPLVALALYRLLPIGRATILTILGAWLLLPVGTSVKIEMIPLFDKYSIANLSALIGCVVAARRFPPLIGRQAITGIMILLFLISPFVTSLLNGDPLVIGRLVLPGVGIYDAGSAVISSYIGLLPLMLAREFLRNSEDIADAIRILAAAGVIYSLPMLFEIRMSPQLHNWIYGYIPYDNFIQQMREGGYRPEVFMGHGLVAAFFLMTACVAAAALWKLRIRIFRLPPPVMSGYLGAVLLLCKTYGALAYGIVLVPLARFTSPRTQVRIAVLLVLIALTYPLLRMTEVFPTTTMLDAAGAVSELRAQSLGERFSQEEMLLERASQRLMFGWGRYGRSRVYDPETMRDITVTDGRWIIVLGQFGFIGFLLEFGLLAFSVLRAAWAMQYAASQRDRVFLAALALIVGINIVDLLPNSTLFPWTWLLAGVLLGRAETLRAAARQRQMKPNSSPSLVADGLVN